VGVLLEPVGEQPDRGFPLPTTKRFVGLRLKRVLGDIRLAVAPGRCWQGEQHGNTKRNEQPPAQSRYAALGCLLNLYNPERQVIRNL